MALAKFLGTYGIKFKGWKNIGISIGIFLLPMMVILVQNDTGSALVFMSFFLVLYREGMPGYFLVSAVWLGILSIISIILVVSSFVKYIKLIFIPPFIPTSKRHI